MSASPQGPGWWQASDLQWYPPTAQPGVPMPPLPQAPVARMAAAPTRLRAGERTGSQIARNGAILLISLVAAAAGIGWGIDALLDEVDLDSVTTEPTGSSAAAQCRIERRTLMTVIAVANASPEPDQPADYLDPDATFDYWALVGQDVVPITVIPPGCS